MSTPNLLGCPIISAAGPTTAPSASGTAEMSISDVDVCESTMLMSRLLHAGVVRDVQSIDGLIKNLLQATKTQESRGSTNLDGMSIYRVPSHIACIFRTLCVHMAGKKSALRSQRCGGVYAHAFVTQPGTPRMFPRHDEHSLAAQVSIPPLCTGLLG